MLYCLGNLTNELRPIRKATRDQHGNGSIGYPGRRITLELRSSQNEKKKSKIFMKSLVKLNLS